MSDSQNSRKNAPKAAPRAAGETARPDVTAPPAAGPSGAPTRIGKFAIQRLLGRGAFGSVYLATDTELERQVAIKMPRAEGLTPVLRDRFLREARATATIHHPNVCPVFEVGTHGDVPYIVMHYVAGGTLATHLDKQGALPPQQAVALGQKLALGVAAAHEKGVTHRDLKPANVLFDPARMLAVVTDFGLAMMTSNVAATADGAVCGTPAYMSPEQAKGKTSAVGPLSDVYSLGVILFHMLTGEVPFRGPVVAVLAQHVNAPPIPPSQVRPGLDPRLDAIVLKAMAKSPAERFASAKALADALAGYASGESRAVPVAAPAAPQLVAKPVPAPPPLPQAVREEPARSVPKSARRKSDQEKDLRKWLLIGGAVVVLVLTFLAGVLAPRLFRSSRTTPTAAKADEPVSAAPKAAPAVVAPKVAPAVTPIPKADAPKVDPPKGDPKPPEPDAVPAASKQAVKDGLEWLAKQQKADGGWEYDVSTPNPDRAAATGMALRPFIWDQAARAVRDDKSDRVIARGLDFLVKLGGDDYKMSANAYAQGIAVIALCEGYEATKDPALRPHAQAAINAVQKAQGPNGSWGYVAGTNGDTSIVGWQVQALHAAKQAGLVVDEQVLKKATAFLNTTAAGARKSMYGYVDNAGARSGTALTAVGLLCRGYLDGWDAAHPGLTDGVAGLAKNGPRGTGEVRDLYYHFYATRVVRLYGGDEWKAWSEGPKGADGARKGGMRDWLVGEQVTTVGANRGSWAPETGFFGTSCGRVGTTAMVLVTLQVCNRER